MKSIENGNNRIGETLHRRMEESGERRSNSLRETEVNGEAWLPDNPHKLKRTKIILTYNKA
jgi:hypothetical protein